MQFYSEDFVQAPVPPNYLSRFDFPNTFTSLNASRPSFVSRNANNARSWYHTSLLGYLQPHRLYSLT